MVKKKKSDQSAARPETNESNRFVMECANLANKAGVYKEKEEETQPVFGPYCLLVNYSCGRSVDAVWSVSGQYCMKMEAFFLATIGTAHQRVAGERQVLRKIPPHQVIFLGGLCMIMMRDKSFCQCSRLSLS